MATKKTDAKTSNSCLCGCGAETARSWAPGHDARVKAQLRAQLGDGYQAAFEAAGSIAALAAKVAKPKVRKAAKKKAAAKKRAR
ncbi:MAG: hypothetical protein KF764_31555 [Labilithrix sp.]|nr:hypothetical protein [Labilithrix sp.]